MKTVSIIVPETAVMSAICDPRYMFTAVNQFLESTGKDPAFKVQIVGLSKDMKLNDGLFSIHPDVLVDDAGQSDLVIIPAISGDIVTAMRLNREYIHWIIEQYKCGAEIASLCIGSFLLASTGLMKGKQCSTHWLYANEFRTYFPDVELVDDKIITEQNGLYSSGGASSYWSLLLYLVEKYTNREMAIMASKFFLLEMRINSQSPFIMFKGQKDHEDAEIVQAQEFIELNYRDKISIDDLCNRYGIGRRTFERRFKKATSNTVIEYMQRVKIEAAKKQIEQGRKTVNEVMYEVGYNDNNAFRDVFKKVTGMSPIEYKHKYCKDLMLA